MNLTTKQYVCIIAVVSVLAIAWQVYKFNDCRAVGHQILYCVGNIN